MKTGMTIVAMGLACVLFGQSGEVPDTTSQAKTALGEAEQVHDATSVQKMPQFPGGEAELYRYMAQAVVYPEEARKKKIGGKVYVEFVVGSDGYVRDVTVKRGVREDLDEAAMEAFRKMPRWYPGELDGKAVAVLYVMPVSFRPK